ncbi:Hpt domain-containing protein [Marinilabilia salmonicolor]|jgi:HPt (histidine-containing phosphotransfer) domain-containing protein|uniref:Hpt domain-containing protein n=1 Tax=Marinilabilia salmonicolor TaxID=989 RepID=UPI000D0629E0|nr:Hpt domain-containing protein [Marinilabilia salmonicolor]PRY95993.1 Hpt domain-containing protein [Marinilabilia salmonicolor]
MSDKYEFVNLSYLQSIAGDDESIINELITIFLDQIPEFTDGLDQSFKEGDWRNVAAIAHKAKSSVLSMGMEELGNVDLKNLELIAKEIFVQEVKKKSAPTEKEIKEAEKMEKNLKGYDEERQKWVNENTKPEKVAELIERFNTTIRKAEKELKTEIKE